MKKTILKSAPGAVAAAASCFGAWKAYDAYQYEDNAMLMENVEALGQDEMNPFRNKYLFYMNNYKEHVEVYFKGDNIEPLMFIGHTLHCWEESKHGTHECVDDTPNEHYDIVESNMNVKCLFKAYYN